MLQIKQQSDRIITDLSRAIIIYVVECAQVQHKLQYKIFRIAVVLHVCIPHYSRQERSREIPAVQTNTCRLAFDTIRCTNRKQMDTELSLSHEIVEKIKDNFQQ